MSLETGTYISDLVATNPTNTDPKAQGDDHIRLLKATIKATWPNVNGAVNFTPAQANALAALFPLTTSNYLRAASTSALESRTPAQVRADVGADNATNLTSGTLPEARLPTTLAQGYTFSATITLTSAIDAFPTGVTGPLLFRTGSSFATPSGFTGTAGSLVLLPRSNSAAAFGVFLGAGQEGVDQALVLGVRKGVVQVIGDSVELRLGATDDFALYHDGTDNNIDSNTGALKIRDSGGTVRAEIGTSGLLVTPASGPSSSEVGFRKVIRQTTGGTLTAAMNGTCQAVSSAVTVDNSVHAAGDAIQIYNNSASAFNITQGSGVTMRLAGTTTTGTRSLAPRGFAYLWFNSASEVIVSGNVS